MIFVTFAKVRRTRIGCCFFCVVGSGEKLVECIILHCGVSKAASLIALVRLFVSQTDTESTNYFVLWETFL